MSWLDELPGRRKTRKIAVTKTTPDFRRAFSSKNGNRIPCSTNRCFYNNLAMGIMISGLCLMDQRRSLESKATLKMQNPSPIFP